MTLEMNYASRNIGDVFYTLRLDDTLNGAVPADGREFSAGDFEADEFLNPYNLCINNRIANVDYVTYDSYLQKDGCCAYFGVDTLNGKFRLPTIKDVFIEAGDKETLAHYLGAAIPNIVGSFSGHDNWISGAFALAGDSEWHGDRNNNGQKRGINFDASRCSSVYKNDCNTVQPPAVKLRAFVQLVVSSGVAKQPEEPEEPESGFGNKPIQNLKVPYTFIPGTEAKALEVNANFDYVLRAIEALDDLPVVHLDGTETIVGKKTFKKPISVPSIELTSGSNANNGGYIDFHFNEESVDYTARIVESTRGYLSINQNPPDGDTSTKIATTSFVRSAINLAVPSIVGNYFLPNWSKSVAININLNNLPYTMPMNGWFSYNLSYGANRQWIVLYINGVAIERFQTDKSEGAAHGGGSVVMVSKGDVLTKAGGYATMSAVAITPFKGES